MKAFQINEYGATPTLSYVGQPTPVQGEVLVKVAAAALNPLDVKLQQGYVKAFFPVDFPYTLGTDLAGTVEVLGAGVTGWAVGDRIVARTAPTAGGALAGLAVVPADQLVRLPDAVTFEIAAGLPTAAGTAWQALFETAHLSGGQTVLIHAGAGGVGSFAIQFARTVGARVIATASGEGIAIAERLGADRVIDYQREDFAALVSDADVVLDTIGGDTQARSFSVLRSGGTLVTTVSPPDEALAKAHNVMATFVFHSSDAKRLGTVVEQLARGVQVLTDCVVPLSQMSKAFEHQASGRARGKIIVQTH